MRPSMLSVEGMRYIIHLAMWGVRNWVEVTELLSEVGRIYEA